MAGNLVKFFFYCLTVSLSANILIAAESVVSRLYPRYTNDSSSINTNAPVPGSISSGSLPPLSTHLTTSTVHVRFTKTFTVHGYDGTIHTVIHTLSTVYVTETPQVSTVAPAPAAPTQGSGSGSGSGSFPSNGNPGDVPGDDVIGSLDSGSIPTASSPIFYTFTTEILSASPTVITLIYSVPTPAPPGSSSFSNNSILAADSATSAPASSDVSVITSSGATTFTSSSASSSSTALPENEVNSQAIAESNVKRALHSAPILVYNATLAVYAQAYADQYDCDGSLTHSGGPYGENLALGTNLTPASAVDLWYNEINNYDFDNPGFSSATSHFTQLVWVATTQVGCAVKSCPDYYSTNYYICSYYPPGNIAGNNNEYFRENVLKS